MQTDLNKNILPGVDSILQQILDDYKKDREIFNNLKIIDYEIKGCVLKLYLGDSKDYYGDDWNDIPFEYNAGIVYKKFIKKEIILYFPFNIEFLEANVLITNSGYCKNDFKNNKVSFIFIVNDIMMNDINIFNYSFNTYEELCKNYPNNTLSFNMTVTEVLDKLFKLFTLWDIQDNNYFYINKEETHEVFEL